MTIGSVTNVWAGDLSLVDLLVEGRADVSPAVAAQLAALGHAEHAAGRLSLTKPGRARAIALRPSESTLRRMFAGDRAGCPLRAVPPSAALRT